jgi:glycosyltransferase involved in cell wall biosynthesis
MDDAAARAGLSRLQASPRRRVLFISHGSAGGVTRHVEELARALEAHVEVLLLRPRADGFVTLAWHRTGESLRLHFAAKDEWPRLEGLLGALGIDRVHYHHVDGHPREVLALAPRLGVAYDVTIHDYFAACPNYHMLDGSGRFCGGEPGCRECLAAGPAPWPMSIAQWREAFGALLRHAERVIAPSADAARRIGRFFPGV